MHSMRFSLLTGLAAGLAAGLTTLSAPAQADAIQAHGGDLSEQLAMLATGDQLVIEDYNGEVSFGGHTVVLEQFSGVAGYGTEVAYLITVSGEAGLDEIDVKPGQMLLVPPFGQTPDKQRFDAARLLEALASDPAVSGLTTVAMLEHLAADQSRGIFLGRYGRTSFNVATMGSTRAEMGRRERVGGVHVRKARFGSDAAPGAIEQQIVAQFLAALAQGDAAAVAQMLDPLPYSGGMMGEAGEKARLAMAASLIETRDWSAFAAATPEEVEETVWRAGEAVIGLRRTSEFAFVESIQVGS